jgi:hypothetical protein
MGTRDYDERDEDYTEARRGPGRPRGAAKKKRGRKPGRKVQRRPGAAVGAPKLERAPVVHGIPTAAQLEPLFAAMRRHGVQHFSSNGISVQLGHEPQPTHKHIPLFEVSGPDSAEMVRKVIETISAERERILAQEEATEQGPEAEATQDEVAA